MITDLPFSLYSTFAIESRHGFNKVCHISNTKFSSQPYFAVCYISDNYFTKRIRHVENRDESCANILTAFSHCVSAAPSIALYAR